MVRKIIRKHIPLVAGFHKIQNRIDHAAFYMLCEMLTFAADEYMGNDIPLTAD